MYTGWCATNLFASLKKKQKNVWDKKGPGLAAPKVKMGCYCNEYHCYEGYDHTWGDEGVTELPKCPEHGYCFCSGGTKGPQCERCSRVQAIRKEGLPVQVDYDKTCTKVNETLGYRYHNRDLIYPGSAFVKAYRKYHDQACAVAARR